MSQEIEISEVTPQPIAAVRVTTNLSRIANDIGSGFGKVMQALGAAGQAPTGAPFCVYHDLIDEQADGDIEICMPVGDVGEWDGEVYGRELEGGSMATAIHKGPYDELRITYQNLMRWIPDNGYQIAGPPREFYLNDPTTVAPDELLTRVEFPVRAAS